MEAVLIIGHDINLSDYDFNNKYIIGIDEGAYIAYKNGIHLDVAIGDFDSIDRTNYSLIKDWTNTIKLNPIKDDTDTMAAINLCKDAKKITILGGIQGKRIEHFIANVILMKNDKRIEMIDNNSHIFTRDSSFIINKNKYKFISLFALEDVIDLTLKGFKYNLDNYSLKTNDPLTISNELIEDKGEICFKEGKILVIMSILDK